MDDKNWVARKALAPLDFERKQSKFSSLKRPNPKGPPVPTALVDKDNTRDMMEERINSILLSATIILNIILLSFFTKMILLLPNKPKIVDPVIFTPGITKNN